VPITFTEQDFKQKSTYHNDAMVIALNITGWVIEKVPVDYESSDDILFMKTFKKISLSPHMLKPREYSLLVFRGKPIVDAHYRRHQVHIPGNSARKLVGVSYVITKFATEPESLLVYYTITYKSASTWIPL
jgi:hypothetical protein